MRHRAPAMLGAAIFAAGAALVFGVAHTQAALTPVLKYAPLQINATGTADQVGSVSSLAISGGLAFVVDGKHSRIAVYNATTGKYLRQIGAKGKGQGQLNLPTGIAVVNDASQKQAVVVVSDYYGNKLVVYRAADGAFVREFGTVGSKNGQLDQPAAIAAGPNGMVYVKDYGNNRIDAFTVAGAFVGKTVDPYPYTIRASDIVDLALDSGGTLWALRNDAILQLSASDLRLLVTTPLKRGGGLGQVSDTVGGITVVRDVGTGNRAISVTDSEGYRVLRFVAGPALGATVTAVDSWPAKGDTRFQYKPDKIRIGGGIPHVLGVVPGYAVSAWNVKATTATPPATKTAATTTTKPATPAAPSWAGSWTTNWGAFTITVSRSSVTGSYTHDSGKITGTVSGLTISGTWSESPTYAGPKDAGSFTITMSADGKSFSGSWKYADGTLGNDTTWTGTR